MKCTFSSTVPAIVCGSRRKSRILFSFTLRPARASAISARSAYATVAWCFVAKPRGSMGSPVSNFCGNCAEPVGFAAAAWWSFPTTLPIIIPESTNPGGTPTPVALIWIFCRPTVPNSIRSNESGSSPAAFVYITAISNAWMVLSPPWRMNLRNGGLVTMSCADYAQLFKTLCLELLRESYLQADETPVWVQMQERRGKHHQAYLWQYSRPGGIVVFDFQMGRGRDGPKQFLGQFNGLLQTDGYKAYDHTGGPNMVHAACWSHAVRYFDDVIKLNPRDPVATPILKEIHELFAIDAEARERGLSLEARQALRLEKSKPLLEGINELVKAAAKTALPASALAKACNYTLTLWERLKLFMEYPELELSNNLAENSMRPVAIGRRNWIHVGSALAGPKVAAILSVVESCRRLKISVRDYLQAVLPGLANVPVSRIPELTPSAWARQP